jgi:hypothetical protein
MIFEMRVGELRCGERAVGQLFVYTFWFWIGDEAGFEQREGVFDM